MLLLCCLRIWVMPLWSSFWVDEMATVYVAQHGAEDPSLRVAPQVADSVYYALPRLTERAVGSSEAAYRIWSVAAMALALFLLARLAGRLIHPECEWFVVFACLSLRGFDYQAADARPYALGTCIAAAGVYLLIRWLDTGTVRDALFFVAAGALLWRVHLVFWPFYLVFVFYATARLYYGDTKVTARQASMVFLILAMALIPVLARALALNQQAASHVVAAKPSLTDLTGALKLALITSCCTGAVFLSRWLGWGTRVPSATAKSSLVLVASWWLCHPLSLFAYSWVTGNSVFLPRYLFLALPGAALAAAASISVLIPPRRWKPLSLAFGAGVLIFVGHWTQFWPMHHNSDWRLASRSLQELAIDNDTPVICPSPFVEARPPVWKPDYHLPGFLYSHLSVYPVGGKKILFPFEISPEAVDFAKTLSASTLKDVPRFAIYGGDHNVEVWRNWFSAREEFAGWRVNRIGPFGDIEAVVFEQPEHRAQPQTAETPRATPRRRTIARRMPSTTGSASRVTAEVTSGVSLNPQ